jgi:hypothetical protein
MARGDISHVFVSMQCYTHLAPFDDNLLRVVRLFSYHELVGVEAAHPQHRGCHAEDE